MHVIYIYICVCVVVVHLAFSCDLLQVTVTVYRSKVLMVHDIELLYYLYASNQQLSPNVQIVCVFWMCSVFDFPPRFSEILT